MEAKNDDDKKAAQPRSGAQMPFGDALKLVIENLKDQPLLLFVLGAAILLLAVATMALEKMRMLLLPLLILFILGLMAWVFLEALNKIKRHGNAGQSVRSGDVKIGKKAQVTGGSTIGSGAVTARGGASNVSSGSIDIQKESLIKGSSVSTGQVQFGGDGDKDTRN